MADKWAQYAEPATPAAGDKWAKYAEPAAAPVKPLSWLEQAGQVLKGGWDNLAQTGQGMVNMVAHPIDTVKGIGTSTDELRLKAEEAFKNGRYLDGLQHVVNYAIPVAGAGIDAMGEEAKSRQPGAIAHASGGALALGLQLAGPSALARGVPAVPGAAGATEPSGLAQRMYHEALGPRVNTPAAESRAMVQTGLENKIPVSEAGAAKLNNLLADLQQQADKHIAPAAARGAKVDPHAVVGGLTDVEQRLTYQVNPEKDLTDVTKSGQEFLRSRGAEPGKPAVPPKPTGILDAQGNPVMDKGKPATSAKRAQPIPVDEAQAIKIGTYRKLAGKYGEQATDAQVEAQKALARGIKEELDKQIPELKDLNAKQGSLFDLQRPLENAVNKAANRQSKGLNFKDVFAGGVAGAVSGNPVLGGAAAVLRHVISDPAVKSRLAIAINQAKRANPTKWGAPNLAESTARVTAFAAALDQQQEQPQQ